MFITWIARSHWPACWAQSAERADKSPHKFADAPAEFVVCTGWHVLCSASPDCKMISDKADCDRMRVNETHIVATAEFQDAVLKRLTLPA